MNQENNSNQPVNYDFITSQGGIEDAKKPKDKKVVIIIILVVITVFMVAILAFATNNSTKEVVQSNELITSKHIKLITEGNFPEAIKLHADSKEISEEAYKYFWGDFMNNRYDFTKCEFDNNPEKTTEAFIYKVDCPLKEDSTQTRVIKYAIATDSGLIKSITDLGND